MGHFDFFNFKSTKFSKMGACCSSGSADKDQEFQEFPISSTMSDISAQNKTENEYEIEKPEKTESEKSYKTKGSDENDEQEWASKIKIEDVDQYKVQYQNPSQENISLNFDPTFEDQDPAIQIANEMSKVQDWFERKLVRNDNVVLSIDPQFPKDEIDQKRMEVLATLDQ